MLLLFGSIALLLLLVLAICLSGLVLVRAVAKVASEVGGISSQTASEVGRSVSEAVGRVSTEVTTQVVETVAREVAKGIGDQLRGGDWQENEGVDSGAQAQAFVPWENWGEEGDGEGDVRWNPDPTDETFPDPEYMDNRNRTVSVPPGYSPVDDMVGGTVRGPRQPNLAGERYRVE